jgi:hypothetical protein
MVGGGGCFKIKQVFNFIKSKEAAKAIRGLFFVHTTEGGYFLFLNEINNVFIHVGKILVIAVGLQQKLITDWLGQGWKRNGDRRNRKSFFLLTFLMLLESNWQFLYPTLMSFYHTVMIIKLLKQNLYGYQNH